MGLAPTPRWPTIGRQRLAAATGVAAALIGTQALAASSPLPRDVRLLLPSEGLLAGLGDGLRRGYDLAMEHTRACGHQPPSLELAWLPPGSDPGAALKHLRRTPLLIAPPAAPLEAYGRLAEQQQLTVLLPLQRGHSLESLPQLPGSDRLWPVVPARGLQSDRLAQGLLADGLRRVIVVRDRSAESKALAERFQASFSLGNGQVIGPTAEPLVVNEADPAALQQLVADVDWYRPQALVVLSRSDGRLRERVKSASWPDGMVLAWPSPVGAPLAWRQLGVDPASRGPGWDRFARSFEQRWGYRPGLVESAGYDTGLLTALASAPGSAGRDWPLQGFSANAQPRPLCQALQQHRQGNPVRPLAATSRLDLSAGVPPTAALALSRAAALR